MIVPKGDFGYNLLFTVLDPDNTNQPYDLFGYIVCLKIWRKGIPGLMLNKPCTIVDAAAGQCSYPIESGDFHTIGVYEAELELTKSGVEQSSDNFTIIVEESF